MITLIFLLSFLMYVILLTLATNVYWIFLWLVVGFILAFLNIMVVLLLHFPIVLMLKPSHRYKSYIMRSLSFFMNHFIFRLKFKIEGLENIPEDGPLVIYCNHKSYTDAFVLLEAINRPITLTPKKSVFKIPLLRMWLRAYDVFPINRDNPRDTVKELEKAVETVKGGHAILVFPQGTIRNRWKTNITDMKPGAFKLAIKAQAQIAIIRFDGSDLVRRRAPFFSSKRKLTVLPIMPYTTYQQLNTQQLADLVMERINQV